jgi:hypothetical protein
MRGRFEIIPNEVVQTIEALQATIKAQAAELTEALDLANHWSITAQEAQHQLRELKRQRDIAVAALERYAAVTNGKLAREALKEIGEVE